MTTEISRNSKLMTRIIYRRGTNFEMDYDQIRYKYFPELSDIDLKSIQYYLEKEAKEIEVFEKEGAVFWKLTNIGIDQTFNDGVNISKMTREEIEKIVRLAYDTEYQKVEINKSGLLKSLNEFPKSLRLEKLIEWSNENRNFFNKNTHPVINAKYGVDSVIQNLLFFRLDNSEAFIYSSLSQFVLREAYSDKELLLKYIEAEFSKWNYQVAYNELIDEMKQESLFSPLNELPKKEVAILAHTITLEEYRKYKHFLEEKRNDYNSFIIHYSKTNCIAELPKRNNKNELYLKLINEVENVIINNVDSILKLKAYFEEIYYDLAYNRACFVKICENLEFIKNENPENEYLQRLYYGTWNTYIERCEVCTKIHNANQQYKVGLLLRTGLSIEDFTIDGKLIKKLIDIKPTESKNPSKKQKKVLDSLVKHIKLGNKLEYAKECAAKDTGYKGSRQVHTLYKEVEAGTLKHKELTEIIKKNNV